MCQTYLFVNLEYFRGENGNIVKATKKWENTFKILGCGKFESFSGVIESILENLIYNSIDKGFVAGKCNKICIKIGNKDGVNYFAYWDTGKGFSKKDYENIPEWVKIDCKYIEEWIKNRNTTSGGKGYGYWLIKRCVDYMNGDFKTYGCQKDTSSIPPRYPLIPIRELKLQNLDEQNYRVIHYVFDKGKADE